MDVILQRRCNKVIKSKLSTFSLAALLLAVALLAAGCVDSTDSPENEAAPEESVVMVTTPYGTAVSSSNVMKLVLEEAGYDVELKMADVGVAWQSVADGSSDVLMDAWLPDTHKQYMDKYENDVIAAKTNLEGGTRCGLVVPAYVTINSIDELNSEKEKFDGRIIGIEPGAGIMISSENAIEEYGLDYELMTGSEVSMITTLMDAIDSEEWVVITGWSPHWKFQRWDLKYLDDPKGVYGDKGDIVTIARLGMDEDSPEAYAILERFEWTPADMEAVMYDMEQGMTEEEAAAKWIENNRDQVDMWLGNE